VGDGRETIRAVATVTLDVGALEGLGPEALDRLAELVAARVAKRTASGRGDAERGGAPSRYLSADGVAKEAGVSRSFVYREIERGRLRAFKVGSRIRIEPEAVERWMESGRVRPRWASPMYEPVTRARGRAASGNFVDELDAIERQAGRAA